MNFLINRLDNLDIGSKSFEFIPENIKKDINMDGMIVGANGQFLVNQKDIMVLIKKSGLKNQIGENMYNAILRKPMMVFLIPTQDSCVMANFIYWINMLNGYNSQDTRDMPITMSNGTISEICLTDVEMAEAIDRMYEVYRCLLPDESAMGRVENTYSVGTQVWNIDKAISTEGKSFARALIILQEARRTGVLSSKIDKYCSVLECIYAIKKEHKKNISNITAAYIGKDSEEQERIRENMRDAYGVRSDGSHGDNLKYLQENNRENLVKLSTDIDDYVRRVFRKVIAVENLNYNNTSEEKARVRKYFSDLAKTVYPE